MQGSRDNMTFVLLGLPSIPKPTEEAKTREAKLEEQLRTLVTGLSYVMPVAVLLIIDFFTRENETECLKTTSSALEAYFLLLMARN